MIEIDDKYFACVVTKEKGTMYAGRELTLVKNKGNAIRFNDNIKAVRVSRELKEIAQRQGLTVLDTAPLIDYENRATQSQKARRRKNGSDAVQSPAHYQLADGLEAIDVIDQAVEDPASFYRGNAIKYLLRAGRKGDAHEDLRKARYYIDRELSNE